MRALSRRDVRGPSDQIKLLIDSYDDKRSGYELAVNPDGVKRDYSMANDQDEDESWDGIWDVATTVDSLGWTAEFRVPLSQLRYAHAEEHTFGFGIWRDIERLKERSAWPLWSPLVQGISSQLGRLTGLRGLSTARRVEVTPYFVSKNVQDAGSATGFDRRQEFTAGGDLKLGLTPERHARRDGESRLRPGGGRPVGGEPHRLRELLLRAAPLLHRGRELLPVPAQLLHRRGLRHQRGALLLAAHRPLALAPRALRQRDDSRTRRRSPRQPSSPGAPRGGFSFGILDAVTQQVGGAGGQTVEPQTNYAVLKLDQELRGGQTVFSVIGTGVNRSLDALTDALPPRERLRAGTRLPQPVRRPQLRGLRPARALARRGHAGGDRAHAAEPGALLPATGGRPRPWTRRSPRSAGTPSS